MDSLHGYKAKINTSSIKEYAIVEENDPNIINAVESVFSTRLDEQVYCGLISLMNAFDPNTSDDDIEKALVSHRWILNTTLNKILIQVC